MNTMMPWSMKATVGLEWMVIDMPVWIDAEILMQHRDLWCWTDNKGMLHEFAYIPAKVVEREMKASAVAPISFSSWIDCTDLLATITLYVNDVIMNFGLMMKDRKRLK